MLKINAWAWFILTLINVIGEPFIFGKPREPYGAGTWISAIISAVISVPICGHILGWW